MLFEKQTMSPLFRKTNRIWESSVIDILYTAMKGLPPLYLIVSAYHTKGIVESIGLFKRPNRIEWSQAKVYVRLDCDREFAV